jgi:hypothetical protein
MCKAAVFLDIVEVFDKIWNPGLLYKLWKLYFWENLIKLISFLTNRKSGVCVECEISTPREIQIRVPCSSLLAPALYNLYINDVPTTPGIQSTVFVNDTCIYATDRKDVYVLRKLQRGHTAMEAWCEDWNIKINEDKCQAFYFSQRRGPVETHYRKAATFPSYMK